MKRIVVFIAVLCCSALLLPSCKGGGKSRVQSEDYVSVRDSLKVLNNAGEVVTDSYLGLLPAADGPGVNYELSLIHYSSESDGVYELVMTYIDAKGLGQDDSYYSYGRYSTLVGIPNDAQASYISLEPFEGSSPALNLVVEKSEALTMLDLEKNRIESQHNYTLVKRH